MIAPLISIIVPCYNVESYVFKALESVFAQSYINWECVIIDDGSSDGTKEKIDFWLEKDSRFVYSYQENKGLSEARNSGLEKANGDFVFFFDSDDLLDIDALRNLEQLVTDEVDIVFGKNALTEGQNTNVKETMKHFPESLVVHKNISKSLLKLVIEKPLSCVAWNRLYRMSFLKKHSLRFTPNLLHEDELWFFETLFYANGIVLNDKPTYYYNIANMDSITNNFGVPNLVAYLRITEILYCKYYKEYTEFLDVISVYITFLKITTITHCYKNLLINDKVKVRSKIRTVFYSVNNKQKSFVLNKKLESYYYHFRIVEVLPVDFIYSFLREFYSLNFFKIMKRNFILSYARLMNLINKRKIIKV